MFSLQNYTKKREILFKYGLIPDKLQIKKMQEISLEIYKDILNMCKCNHLTDMLGGGSALGAVRHHGFIPWDDDIDLIMPRNDYDAFIRLFDSNLGYKYKLVSPDCKYGGVDISVRVVNPHTKKVGMFDSSKFQFNGICVDINALDYVPDKKIPYYIKGALANVLLFLTNSKFIYLCRTMHSKRFFSQNLLSRSFYSLRIFLGTTLFWISYHKLCYYYDKFIASNTKHRHVSIPSGRGHYFKETHAIEIFFPIKEIEFENVKSFVPNNYNAYLSKLYGKNYMEIPVQEKRDYHPYVELEL